MILDTNALSAWGDADENFLRVLPVDRPLHLPAIVVGEYRFGLIAARNRVSLEGWLEEIERALIVLSVDGETARHYADVREEMRQVGTPLPENDLWIGALSRQHRLSILTRDKHFDQITGVRRVAW